METPTHPGAPHHPAIRFGEPEDLPALEPLWLALYEHQRQAGMLLAPPPGAFLEWQGSLAPLLGRFACLVVAERGGRPVGFLAGRVRSVPLYFGGQAVGFVSDVYVDDRERGQGLGEAILDRALGWFREQGLSRVELQVLAGNTGARVFYRRLGWVEELVQMVWTPPVGEREG
jgi:GNAT superfamily N-acetyltransferase